MWVVGGRGWSCVGNVVCFLNFILKVLVGRYWESGKFDGIFFN